jgi:formylglycine-generating enzyme required for sulfatase activity
MMKNIEWGAVAYLSRSTYGKNAEITINISLDYYTGGDSGTAYVTNVGQSTTGNIYGIYDISGGAYEYVMGNFNNTTGSSGLTPSSINNKYIDRYTAYDSTKYGDAVYETSTSTSGTTSWHGDFSFMINASSPWFICGGNYVDGSMAGAFSFAGSTGGVSSSHSWRSVVLTGEGL